MMSACATDAAIDLLPVCPHRCDEVTVRVVSQPEEMLSAFRLAYQSYVRAGLAWPNPEQLRVTPYQLEDASELFLALKDEEVIATVSLIPDGSKGLPMESIYPNEVRRLRRERRIAEVSCLADRRQKVERSVPALLYLFKLLVHNARYHGIDQLLIAVHPRHVAFYERMIGFQQIAGVRNYAAVLDRPAVALSINLDPPNAESKRAYRDFYRNPLPTERVVRAVPRCQGFIERMKYFARAQARWEAEIPWTDRLLVEADSPDQVALLQAVPA